MWICMRKTICPININSKAKAKEYFRGINFTLISVSTVFLSELFYRGREKPININNFAGLSRKWVGVKLFMCFPFSWGKRETHKLRFPGNLRKRPGESRDSPWIIPWKLCLCVFLFIGFFFPALSIGVPQMGVKCPGGLSKSEDIWGKMPFCSGKGQKRQNNGRFGPFSGKGGQTPLKPPFVTPLFAASQFLWTFGHSAERGFPENFGSFSLPCFGASLAPYRGPFGPKKSKKARPRGQKRLKKSRKRWKSRKKVVFDSFLTFFRFFQPFLTRGREAPKTVFRLFLGFRARRARMTPVRGQGGCNSCFGAKPALTRTKPALKRGQSRHFREERRRKRAKPGTKQPQAGTNQPQTGTKSGF